MSVDAQLFRSALGHFASGVTVVTVRHLGENAGFTATAFSSVSLQPPLILICVDQNASSRAILDEAGHFAVNVLSAEQESISRTFASRGVDRFADLNYNLGQLEDPLIARALVQLECKVVQKVVAGDHTVYFGEVQNAHVQDGTPLLHFQGKYRQLTPKING